MNNLTALQREQPLSKQRKDSRPSSKRLHNISGYYKFRTFTKGAKFVVLIRPLSPPSQGGPKGVTTHEIVYTMKLSWRVA